MAAIPLPDDLYSLPSVITDADLREWFEVIVAKLRDDAAGTSMCTIQELLLERIAYNYVVLRWKEREKGPNGGFEHSKYHKDYNTFWLAMTQEFMRNIRGDKDADVKEQVLRKVGVALSSAFDGLHEDVAGPMKERIASALEGVGL